MSGGSYNYLYCKDSDALLNEERELTSMAERLAELGYAEDAARETEELLLIIRQAKIRIDVRARRLSGVWHAVEWWDSADSGEDGVKHALDAYRNPKDTPA